MRKGKGEGERRRSEGRGEERRGGHLYELQQRDMLSERENGMSWSVGGLRGAVFL